jgi:hypothetical protein
VAEADFLAPPGDPASPDGLTVAKAREMVRLLTAGAHPYAQFIETRSSAEAEIAVLEVDVEVPQHCVYDIRRIERLAILFRRDDESLPEVLALRPDFPLVPHLNLRLFELPRSLCLYDRPYYELKLGWTAMAFVERIRTWLARTAKGLLHEEDQPLEPILMDPAEDLILPASVFEAEQLEDSELLRVRLVQVAPKRTTYIAEHWSVSAGGREEGPGFIATAVTCPPQPHGIIRRVPDNLSDLHDLMLTSGSDLLGTLRGRLGGWMKSGEGLQQIQDDHLIIVAHLPKTRAQGGPVETTETRAFVILHTIKEIGEAIGVWGLTDGEPGLLFPPDEAKRGEKIKLAMLNPRRALSRPLAAQLNALNEAVSIKVAVIGVGALGSQVVTNLVRAGFGQWTIIDDDILLPHNIARHALGGFFLGASKAQALAAVVNRMIDGDDIARAIIADVLRPGEQAEALQNVFRESDVIVDMSISVAVARYLALDLEAAARRMSLFLNPSGTGLILLAEDTQRLVPLDMLEMQFYRELAANPALAGFLRRSDDRIHAGQSCRDITTRLPQDLVALQGAIGSRALRESIRSGDPTLSVWRVGDESVTVNVVQVTPSEVTTERIGEWTISTDAKLLGKLAALRSDKLPNETGGVLVGAFDMQRKIVYVVDTIPSPPDSEEWPTHYIRGCQGLMQRVQEIGEATGGMLQYVGEWHSHPEGHDASPSSDDLTVRDWVAKWMDTAGLPGLLAIAAQGRQVKFLLGGLAITEEEVLDGADHGSLQAGE